MLTDNNKIFHRKKILTIFLVCTGIFLALLGRLVYLCVWESEHYSAMATQLHERERSIKAARGRILDRNGIVLADNRTVCTISVIHNQVEDPEKESGNTIWPESRWMRTTKDIIPMMTWPARCWALPAATIRESSDWRWSMTNTSRESREKS